MFTDILNSRSEREGARERKQRDTKNRIAETGLRLFLANGFDTTTLDQIAEEVGISRRTFFSYFKSKDDILLAWHAASWQGFLSELLKVPPENPPLYAVSKNFIKNVSRIDEKQMIAIDKVMRSSSTLMAKKQATYIEQELSLYHTLCEVWREPERRVSLRIVALLSIGAMRLAIESWTAENYKGSALYHFENAFINLKKGLEEI